MASLRDLQRSFAASLRDPSVACAVSPPANLSIYRNNSSITFRVALERTFPVVRKRVGEDFFRQLAHHYRERFPSRSADLHWAGKRFAEFLDEHLRGDDYAWLADLARLEWSREVTSLQSELPSIRADALASFPSGELEHLLFTLQPSLRLHASSYPIFSVWLANQAENAPPVDQSLGSEFGMVRPRAERVEVRLLEPRLFSYLSALAGGSTLGEAVTIAGLDQTNLLSAFGFLFSENLVRNVTVKSGASAQ
jgi:hypothetical protein